MDAVIEEEIQRFLSLENIALVEKTFEDKSTQTDDLPVKEVTTPKKKRVTKKTRLRAKKTKYHYSDDEEAEVDECVAVKSMVPTMISLSMTDCFTKRSEIKTCIFCGVAFCAKTNFQRLKLHLAESHAIVIVDQENQWTQKYTKAFQLASGVFLFRCVICSHEFRAKDLMPLLCDHFTDKHRLHH